MNTKRKQISLEQARRVGECLYLDWNHVDIEKFRRGLMGSNAREAEYQAVCLAGRTVMTHMEQIPDYLVRLARLRAETQARQGNKRRSRTMA